MKYIDAEKLIAEIKREIELTSKNVKPAGTDYKSVYCRGAVSALYTVKNRIIPLLQEEPELDLEKEATKFVQSKEFIESKESPVLLTARHFYELGLNSRKEE